MKENVGSADRAIRIVAGLIVIFIGINFKSWSMAIPIEILGYCQMLCMALGGDPFFNNAINKLHSTDYFSKTFRMVQFDPSFLSTTA